MRAVGRRRSGSAPGSGSVTDEACSRVLHRAHASALARVKDAAVFEGLLHSFPFACALFCACECAQAHGHSHAYTHAHAHAITCVYMLRSPPLACVCIFAHLHF